MAGDNNSTKLEFRLGQDDWELYTERLELYFIANDVSAEKQVAVLLTKIGAETNKLIRDLCAPVKPSEKKFADLVILVKNHLNRKPSETMERCKFYQAHQAATETVADFVARLRNLSINCNFGDVNVALRDQLVCGLKDHATKKALFRDENLAYDSAYRIAVAMDEEEKNASATDKISNEKTVDNASINVIRSNPKKEKQKQPAPNERGRSVHRGRRQGQRYNKESMTNNGSRASNNNTKSRSAGRLTCYCCDCKITSAATLNAYGEIPLESEGVIENLNVKLGDREATLKIRVMTRDGPMLIGRQWLKVFGLWPLSLNLPRNVNSCNKIDVTHIMEHFANKFPKLFGPGPGLYNKGRLKLVLKENTQPVALKARHLPFALSKNVEDEINRLVKLRHLEKVDVSEWATPIVPWPNIDKDIGDIAAACKVCVRERKKSASVPLTPWPYPDKCWSRIHTDLLGPFHGHMFMIIIDANSKWPEVIDMQKCTEARASRVIDAFKKVLVRFGLPRHLVSDNGRQFTGAEFQEFCKSNGIKQSFTAPHHPATNGGAENFVGTFKDKVDKIVSDGKSLQYAINLFLFDYRTTEHCTTGRTPAYMMYKRELRTRFDLLKPDVNDHVNDSS
ncbi:hypothetical protein KPH14_012210 [Odynerus spinipes]|uniref:Integrase catalytic domain-containing protein n=1 Tax=Odynerus spinipes TaxID=1348599 RepID=A0AAD9RF70_9HYME|nr:hypothetical protein KPH14_012210 [Odynerus spinipes]